MHELRGLIEHELVTRLLSGKKPLATFNKGEQSFWILYGFFVAVGAGFLIYAAYLWLSRHYAADTAAALTGGLSLICALVVAVVIYGIIEYRRNQILKLQQNLFETVKESLSTFENEYGEPIREYPKISILLAFLVGFILEKRVL